MDHHNIDTADRQLLRLAVALLLFGTLLFGILPIAMAQEPEAAEVPEMAGLDEAVPAELAPAKPAPAEEEPAEQHEEPPAESLTDTAPVRSVQLETVSSRVRRQLQQLDALVAESAWTEALELWDEIFTAGSQKNQLIEVSPGRFVSLIEHCHARLAAWPAEAIEHYRQRVDPIARQQFETAIAKRDQTALIQLLRDSYCSSWGDDALLALGDMALERADFPRAQSYWRQIHPMLSDAKARPLDWALKNIDLKEHATEVIQRLQIKPRVVGVLGYPDSDLPLAELLVRLTLASVRQDELISARQYLELLSAVAPEAEGQLAGQQRPYVEALTDLIAESEGIEAQPQTARREPQRAPVRTPPKVPLVGSLWAKPHAIQRTNSVRIELDMFGRRTPVPQSASDLLPVGNAAHWEHTAILRKGNRIVAVDLLTGEPAITRTGILYEGTRTQVRRNSGARIIVQNGRRRVIQSGAGQFMGPTEAVTIHGNYLYARVNPTDAELQAAAQNQPQRNMRQRLTPQLTQSRIIGRDLSRENLTVLELPPPDAPWQFGGPPLLEGERLYVALAADDVRPRVGVACYSAITGRLLWETSVCSGQPSTGFGPMGVPTQRLLQDGSSLYLNTHLGAIAALEKRTGTIRWAMLYQRKSESENMWAGSSSQGATGSHASLLRGEQLFVAPSDSTELLAIDTATGQTLWQQSRPAGSAHLLAIAGDALVIGGDQLTRVSASDGTLHYRWPDSPKGGLRGRGVSCRVGTEIFWPTRDRVFAFDVITGRQTRPSLDISYLGGSGANLTAAGGMLIAIGTKSITVLGPTNRRQSETLPRFSYVKPLTELRTIP